MTAPVGGGGATGGGGAPGGVNLATLWVPVVPDTSKIGDAMRHAGEDARRQFEESFTNTAGSSGMFDRLTSQLGNQFSQEISAGLQRGLSGMELPAGLNRVTDSLMRGFEGVRGRTEMAAQALHNYEQAHERLVAALDREAVAQSRVNDLRERGAAGTQMLSATNALEAAHRRVASATDADTAAHRQFQDVMDSGSSSLMTFAASTGIVSGAISAGITLGAEAITKMVEASIEGFEKIVEGAEEVAKKIVEVGEKFEDLHRSIELSTVASGSALDELKNHSDALVASLDTSFDKVGTDMATLSSRLNMEAGPALDALTHDVEELRDRFGSLDVTALAGAFDQFGISGEHADQTLASLVHSAREFGVGLNQLVTDLAEAGPTLQEFNLSAEQSGHLLAELEAKHISAASAVNMLARAEKAAGEQHRDIAEFVQSETQIIEQYAAAGNKAAADQEAFLAFGVRGWVQATQAAKAYLENLKAGPDAYKGNTVEMQHFIAMTESLENRWESLKNKMTVAFAPLASVALDKISEAMSKLGEWIESHEDQVLGFVRRLGESFINAIPLMQEFAEATLKFMGEVSDEVAKALGTAMIMIGHFGEQLHAIPGLAKLLGPLAEVLADNGQALERTGQSLVHLNLEQYTDRWSDGIKKFRPDLQGMTRDLDESTDALKRQLDALNNERGAMSDAGPQGEVGHIAPPSSAFGAQPPDVSAPGADSGGSEGGLPGGDQPPESGDQPGEGGAPEVVPRSYLPAPPPSGGVGGPQHVRLAGWHSTVEQADWMGGHREGGERGGGGEHGGEHHDSIFGGHERSEHVGPTNEQQRQHTRRLEDLNDKIDDDSDSITDLTQKQKDASGKLQHDTALRDTYQQGSLTWIEENKQVIADQKAYAEATKELTRTLRDRKRAEEDIQDESAKYGDELKGRRGGAGGGGGGVDSNAQQLGAGLLSGLMSDLGLGNVFGGKSPLDWALPKMAMGALDWGLGALNTMAGGGEDGGGGGGGAAGGGGGGGGGGFGLGGLLHNLFGGRPAAGAPGAAVTPTGPVEISPFGPNRGVPPGWVAGAPPAVQLTPAAPNAPGLGGAVQHPPGFGGPDDSIIPPTGGAPIPVPMPGATAPGLPPGTHPSGFIGGGDTPNVVTGGMPQQIWRSTVGGGGLGGGGGARTVGAFQPTGGVIGQPAQLASARRLAAAGGGREGNAAAIYNAVTQAGYSPNTATAAVAAAMYESSLNPDITNPSGHHGLFQESSDKPSAGAQQQVGWFVDQLNKLGGPSVVDRDPTSLIADKVEIGGYSGSNYNMGAASQLIGGLSADDTGGGGAAPYTPAAFPPAAGGGFAGGGMNPNMPALDNPASVASRVPNAPNVEAGIRAIGGLPTLYDTSGANAYQVPGWTQQLAKDFGLTASTYASGGSLHQMGYAFDFNGPQPNMDAFADYIQQNLSPQTLQLIHASGDRRWGIASGQDVSAGGYYAGDYGGHFDHVHWATDVPPIMGDQAAAGLGQFAPAGFQGAGAVPAPGGPAVQPPAANLPNINPMTAQPHYTGPTLPGPMQKPPDNISSGVNIQSSPASNFAQQSYGAFMSGLFSVIGSQIGSPDYNPRYWQNILHEPEWAGVQHQHQPVQSAQSIVQNFDHSIDLSGSTVADPAALQRQMREEQLSRYYTIAGGLPQGGVGSP